jgi:hypothetical protein
MKKEITICFRTSDDLRSSLEEAARKDRRSLSSAIELILTDYVSKSGLFPQQQERRRHTRKAVSIAAQVKSGAPGGMQHQAVVLDISLSGLRLALPKECTPEIYAGAEAPQFEASFTLPEQERPLRFLCKPERVVPFNGSIHVGARFVDTKLSDYQQLQQYLI